MTSLTRPQLDTSLKAGRIAPLYLLTGCEVYLREAAARAITETALAGTLLREFNESSFSLLSDSASGAIAVADQLPMMSERVVVRIRDFGKLREADEEIIIRYLNKPSPSSVVIFIADDLDKRKKLTKTLLTACTVIDFSAVKDAEAKAWARTRLKEMKTSADDRVLSEIVRLGGTDLQTLNSELEKLAAAALETRAITMQMVDDLIGHSRELSNFDLGDQLIAGDRRRALMTLHHLIEDNVAPVMLIGLIASNYHRLALAKELMRQGRRDEASRLVYGSYEKKDAFFNTLQRRDAAGIARDLKLIADADLALKTSLAGGGPKGARLQLEMLICALGRN
ncbi:MAG: polymerase subunit delta [Pyrinomonadaceae bacterium]|jgi:DNA polymerase-3 subunit delta|nr:polymerase subunit delta [Pyrinomonadaceae bacterium]